MKIADDYSLFNTLYGLEDRYKFSICLKDFTDFIHLDSNLEILLTPFIRHKNPYCVYLKSVENLRSSCFRSKALIYQRLSQKRESFFGTCYAGIGEYVVPVLFEDKVICAICVGLFSVGEDKLGHYLDRISRESVLDKQEAAQFYVCATRSASFDCSAISELFSDVDRYLVERYRAFKKQDLPDNFTLKGCLSSNEFTLLSMALDYIDQNQTEPLSVVDICDYCCCSISTLNHVFKKNVGINIKGYINKLRIKKAKMFLQKTNKSITEIAFSSGFNDSNYFTKVFKQMTHSTPKDYRRKTSMKMLSVHHF